MKKAYVLIIVLSLFLTGCTNRTASQSADTPSFTISDNSLSVSDAENTRQAATGRFVETDITPPQTSPLCIWLTNAGIVCQTKPTSFVVSNDFGSSWSEWDTGWMESIGRTFYSVQQIEANGTIWAIFEDTNANDSLWRIELDGNAQQVFLDGVVNYFSVEIEAVLKGNRILARFFELSSGEEKAGVFDISNGKLLYEIVPPFGTLRWNDFFAVDDEYIYCLAPGGHDISDLNATVFQISDGTQVEEYKRIIPVQGLTIHDFEIADVAVAQGYFYYVNHLGLNRVALGGSLSEVLLETERFSFHGRGMLTDSILVAPDYTFYIFSQGFKNDLSKPAQLLKYTYDPDMPFHDSAREHGVKTFYYIDIDRGNGSDNGTLFKQDSDTDPVTITDKAKAILAENQDVLVFSKSDTVGSNENTLHYYDKASVTVNDIFSDTWIDYIDYTPMSGQVLGVWYSEEVAIHGREWQHENPNYFFIDGKLRFFVSHIEKNTTDIYYFDFGTRTLELKETIDWNTFLTK